MSDKEAAPEITFSRKKKRGQVRKRKAESDNDSDADAKTLEVLELTKFHQNEKKRRKGVLTEDLLVPKEKVKNTVEEAQKGGLTSRAQLQTLKENDPLAGPSSIRDRIMSGQFTTESNHQEVNKQMQEYIEKRLTIRRTDEEEFLKRDEVVSVTKDLEEELFATPAALAVTSNVSVKEDSAQSASSFLLQVPEVELSVENKLRNIEKTERAKRELLEKNRKQRQIKPKDYELPKYEGGYAAQRFVQYGSSSNVNGPEETVFTASKETQEQQGKGKRADTQQGKNRAHMSHDDIMAARFRAHSHRH
eukprot:GCRY01001389.1.p1 GENE.GCRY01001389.1~~GCRY01001389.1.p1  ORF type:complete len:305 (-),score=53.39 GCRY01001389.1:84-998(-)